jgi:hypothetical protein
MLLTIKILAISVAGTAPIVLVWALGWRRWLVSAVIFSALLAVGIGDPIYDVVDLAAVAVAGLLAYVSLSAEDEEEWS